MTPTRKSLLWTLSIALVGAIHLALFYWAMNWHVEPLKAPLPPPAMMIELAPLPAPTPAPTPAPVVAPEPEPVPKIVEAPKPRIELPKPKPVERPTPKPKPLPKPKPKPAPEPTPASSKPVESQSQATKAAPTQKAATKAAPPASTGPSAAKVSWQSRLMAHLARYKRYPDDARRRNQEGRVTLRFTVDANGRVVSHTLVGRSGSPSLDRATQQMIRRAQPLPKPPADVLRNGTIEVVAPFDYSLQRR